MKIDKILIIGSFGQGALENFYSESFKLLRIQVFKYDIQTPFRRYLGTSILNKVAYRLGFSNKFLDNIN
ncbi:hypothetical protein, partial [Pontibacter fetidus]